MVIIPTEHAEVSDIFCEKCDFPAFQEGLTFWCPGCDEQVEM